MAERAFSSGDVLRRGAELAGANSGKLIFAIAILAALAATLELETPRESPLRLAVFGASLWFQYDLTRALLDSAGLMPGGYRDRRLVPLMLLLLLSQSATFIGYVALVAAAVALKNWMVLVVGALFIMAIGILLTARWLMSVPILIVEETGVVESLRRSWEETSGQVLALLGVVVALNLPMIAAYAAAVWLAMRGSDPAIPVFIVDVTAALCLALGWCAAVAAYALRGSAEKLDQVFR
jgi:hypothetical protein